MLTPRDKVKRVTSWVSLVEPSLAKELRARGAYIARQRVMNNLCVSCAVHFGVAKVRSAEDGRLSSESRPERESWSRVLYRRTTLGTVPSSTTTRALRPSTNQWNVAGLVGIT